MPERGLGLKLSRAHVPTACMGRAAAKRNKSSSSASISFQVEGCVCLPNEQFVLHQRRFWVTREVVRFWAGGAPLLEQLGMGAPSRGLFMV